MYPAEKVTAVLPPGMKRATMMRYVPRSASWRSAHSNPRWRLVPLEDALDRVLAEPGAEPVRDVVAEDRARRGAEDHERQAQVAGARQHPGADHDGLARHDGEERVDRRHGEDREVRPVARDPFLELVERRQQVRQEGEEGHAAILAETAGAPAGRRPSDDARHDPPAASGNARARRDDVDRRPVLRADPGGARRGRRQGRATRYRRRRPCLGPAVLGRRGHDLPLRQRRQAVARALAARPARRRGAAPARRRRRRVPPEPPTRARG